MRDRRRLRSRMGGTIIRSVYGIYSGHVGRRVDEGLLGRRLGVIEGVILVQERGEWGCAVVEITWAYGYC